MCPFWGRKQLFYYSDGFCRNWLDVLTGSLKKGKIQKTAQFAFSPKTKTREVPVWSKKSCGLLVVIFQETLKSFPKAN